MANEEDKLRERLRHVEVEIYEVLRRIPPHSVKPPVMIDLLTLEDERDILLKKLGELR